MYAQKGLNMNTKQTYVNLQCLCFQGGRFLTRLLLTVPSQKRCVSWGRCTRIHLLIIVLACVASQTLKFADAMLKDDVSLFLFFSACFSLFHFQTHGTSTDATNTHPNTMCHVRPRMRVRVYTCRGIEILSNSAGPMLKGFLACSRSHLSLCLPPSLPFYKNTTLHLSPSHALSYSLSWAYSFT